MNVWTNTIARLREKQSSLSLGRNVVRGVVGKKTGAGVGGKTGTFVQPAEGREGVWSGGKGLRLSLLAEVV